MLKIGLTGGIGAGKTTVTQLFAELGIPIIDADVIAHQLVQPGQPALYRIRDTFGPTIIDASGGLDRAKLRSIVFNDSELKKKLEAIVHPLVFQEIEMETDRLDTLYCIVSIPLLFETGMQHSVDRILVVDCPPETQIVRVMQRNGLSETEVRKIIAAQTPRALRIEQGDDIIDNSTTDTELAEQVKKLHNLYLSLSSR
ncbi:MAG: dephospho-CoA kinase [Gammaproteobacteria bacterium]